MTTHRGRHYLLFSEAIPREDALDGGTWRFSLDRIGAGQHLAASDFEETGCVARLELLAVVRGLEALDEPARVTLVTGSRYVGRGLKFGLPDWRAADWQWERFGQVVPIRDCDLWRRVDRALAYHQVECRLWRFGASIAPSTHAHRPTAEFPGSRLAAAARARLRRVSAAAAQWSQSLQPAGLAAG